MSATQHREFIAQCVIWHPSRLNTPACRTLPTDFVYGSKPSTTDQRARTEVSLQNWASTSTSGRDGVDAGLGKSIREGWKNEEVPERVSLRGLLDSCRSCSMNKIGICKLLKGQRCITIGVSRVLTGTHICFKTLLSCAAIA